MKKVIVGVVLAAVLVIVPNTARAAWYDGILNFFSGGEQAPKVESMPVPPPQVPVVLVSGATAQLGTPIVSNNETIAQAMSFVFTITAGNDALYITKDPAYNIATSSTGFANPKSATITDITANPASISGDSTWLYIIPAGSSRTFIFSGSMKFTGSSIALKTFQINAIRVGLSSNSVYTNPINIINGLENLKVSTVGGAGTATTPQPFISVYAPVNNETFSTGATVPIRWANSNYTGGLSIDIMTWNRRQTLISTSLVSGTTQYNFPLGNTAPGTYIILVRGENITSDAVSFNVATATNISSVTNPVQVGDIMNIRGTGLISDNNQDANINSIDLALLSSNGWVLIDGVPQKNLQFTGYEANGSLLSFKLPQLAIGQHSVRVKNAFSTSNSVSFQVGSSTSQQVVVTLDPASPLQGIYAISRTATTQRIPIAKYSIKSMGTSGVLRSLDIVFKTTKVTPPSGLFKEIHVNINGHTWLETGNFDFSTGNQSTLSLTDMEEILPADQKVTLTVDGTIAADTNGIFTGSTVSTSIVANQANPRVENSTGTALPVKDTIVTSNTLTFSSENVVVSGTSATLGNEVISNNAVIGRPAVFIFTINAGNDTLYITKDPTWSIATSGVGFGVGNKTILTTITANPGSISGDTNWIYVIPAGSSRTFSVSGMIDYKYTTQPQLGLQITGIKYGTSSNNPSSNTITTGLEALKVTTLNPVVPPAPYITISSPTALKLFMPGQVIPIRWTTNIGGDLSMDIQKLETGEFLMQGRHGGNQPTSFDFQIPTTAKYGQYAIHIYSSTLSNSVIINIGTSTNPGTTTPPTATTSVTVVSPNTPVVLNYQKANTISWSGGKDKVLVGVVDPSFEKGGAPLGWITLNGTPNGNTAWNAWTVTDLSGSTVSALQNLSSGPYKIIVVSANATNNYCFKSTTTTCNVDLSNAYFTINAPTPSPSETPTTNTAPTTSKATIINKTVQLGAPVLVNNLDAYRSVTFRFTVVAGTDTVYIPKNLLTLFTTTSSGFAVPSLSGVKEVVAVTPATISGDSVSAYVVPAGSARAFTYVGKLDNTNGFAGLRTFQITAINYGYSSTGTVSEKSISNSIDFKVTFTMGDGPSTQTTVPPVSGSLNTSTQTAACPSGYSCVPTGSSLSCATGYTCTQVYYGCPSGYSCYTKYYNAPSPSAYPSASPSTIYSPVFTPSASPSTTYIPSPTYSTSPSASASVSASPTTVATPKTEIKTTTSSSPSPSSSASASPVSFKTGSNILANVFYSIGDILDAVF